MGDIGKLCHEHVVSPKYWDPKGVYREKRTRLRTDLWVYPFRWHEEQWKPAMEAEKEEEDGAGRQKPRVLSTSKKKVMKCMETLRRTGHRHCMWQVNGRWWFFGGKQDSRGRDQNYEDLKSEWWRGGDPRNSAFHLIFTMEGRRVSVPSGITAASENLLFRIDGQI